MRILVLSDTHKVLGRVYEVLRQYEDIDIVFHLGDNIDDAKEIQKRTNKQVVYVAGNTDFASNADELYKVYKTEVGNILLTHGHKESVSYDLSKLRYKAMENDCKMALYGHTHIASYEEIDDIKFLNPGSLTKPRDGSFGTYAIITVDKDLNADIVHYKDPSKKAEGGYIRGLINYSDRF